MIVDFPCNIGDKVWVISHHLSDKYEIYEHTISKMMISKEGIRLFTNNDSEVANIYDLEWFIDKEKAINRLNQLFNKGRIK